MKRRSQIGGLNPPLIHSRKHRRRILLDGAVTNTIVINDSDEQDQESVAVDVRAGSATKNNEVGEIEVEDDEEKLIGNFFLERVVAKRSLPEGGTEYKIKWLGYSEGESSWSPANLIPANFKQHYEKTIAASESKLLKTKSVLMQQKQQQQQLLSQADYLEIDQLNAAAAAKATPYRVVDLRPQCILAYRLAGKGNTSAVSDWHKQYLIKWRNEEERNNSWEPAKLIQRKFGHIVDIFEDYVRENGIIQNELVGSLWTFGNLRTDVPKCILATRRSKRVQKFQYKVLWDLRDDDVQPESSWITTQQFKNEKKTHFLLDFYEQHFSQMLDKI